MLLTTVNAIIANIFVIILFLFILAGFKVSKSNDSNQNYRQDNSFLIVEYIPIN